MIGGALVTATDEWLPATDVVGVVLGGSAVLVEHPASAQIIATEVRATEIRLVMDLATPLKIVR